METVRMVLFAAGMFLVGFVVAQLTQRIVVPLLVCLIGARHFASPSAFDGCTLGIYGGVATFVVPVFLKAKRSPFYGASPSWVLAFIALGITLYSLVYLWFLGFGGRKREWRIRDGRILKKGDDEIRPTFVRERQDYFQTDAYNGYSHYFLELHGKAGLLGTNAYTSKDEFEVDMKRVRELTNARRLDLMWSCRLEETKWLVAYFSDEWAPVLCGSLDRLDHDDRKWWQMWVYPNFESHDGSEVDAQDARGRLRRFNGLYGDELKKVDADFADGLLATGKPIIAMSHTHFYKHIEEVRGTRDLAFLRHGDFIELVP